MSGDATSIPPVRRAVVRGGLGANLDTVRQYLPSNYRAEMDDGAIVISGRDDHGWTLDGYVIPRLASGLIAVEEVPAGKLSGCWGLRTGHRWQTVRTAQRELPCQVCRGKGELSVARASCPACAGHGRVLRPVLVDACTRCNLTRERP